MGFLNDLREILPEARTVVVSGAGTDRGSVDQATLHGSIDLVSAAVAAIPNEPYRYGYDEWVRFAAAIRAACGSDEQAGLAIFEEFSARGEHPDENDLPGRVYWSNKPPFGIGASWLYETAEKHGWTGRAQQWFDAEAAADAAIEVPIRSTNGEPQYQLHYIDQLLAEPNARYIVERHIPENSLGFLYGDPSAGKSFIALDMALQIATGAKQWHGDAITDSESGTVIYLASEGTSGLKLRLRAWFARHGIDPTGHRRFAVIKQSVNFMAASEVELLITTLRERAIPPVRLIVVDTVSRALPGADENAQKDMTLFVAACDRIRAEFSCVVLGVHHANRAGDLRGSSVLRGAGDFVFKLARKADATIVRLTCEKQKDGPDGWSQTYQLDKVWVDSELSSLVPVRAVAALQKSIELPAETEARILTAMQDAWEAKRPWGETSRSGSRFAVTKMVAEFGIDADQAAQQIKTWRDAGIIQIETADKKTKLKGYCVIACNPSFSNFGTSDPGEADDVFS